MKDKDFIENIENRDNFPEEAKKRKRKRKRMMI